MPALNQTTIIEQLRENHERFAKLMESLNEKDFNTAPAGKWTAGQQFDHIYLSIKPLTMALGLPKLGLRVLIGSAKRPSREYEAVVEKYHDALANGGIAPGSFVPESVHFKDKDALIEKLKKNLAKLISNLNSFDEEGLDQYILPHPLLGKMTVREMLYFTIYHCEHHYKVTLQNLGR